jgi:tryptophan synthase alpha chain
MIARPSGVSRHDHPSSPQRQTAKQEGKDAGRLEAALRAGRKGGRTLLMPFVTGGVNPAWGEILLAYRDAGAHAIEVGLPFSDPMLDGATIQQASDRALRHGATVDSIVEVLSALHDAVEVPLVVSTYMNLVVQEGAEEFCRRLATAGVAGLIVPDLPLEESGGLEAAAADAGIDLVLLVAPVTGEERLREICARSRGFVYAVSVMGTTGERAALAASAGELAARVKAVSDRPVLIGFGVSGPEQACEAGRAGDGVVIGAALMRRVLDGATPGELARDVGAVRAALDQEVPRWNGERPSIRSSPPT